MLKLSLQPTLAALQAAAPAATSADRCYEIVAVAKRRPLGPRCSAASKEAVDRSVFWPRELVPLGTFRNITPRRGSNQGKVGRGATPRMALAAQPSLGTEPLQRVIESRESSPSRSRGRGMSLFAPARIVAAFTLGGHQSPAKCCVASQSPWRMAIPLPAGLSNSHRNGGRNFLIIVKGRPAWAGGAGASRMSVHAPDTLARSPAGPINCRRSRQLLARVVSPAQR